MPHLGGGKDWEAGAYSPLTNTMYMPLRNTCARMLATDDVRSERARALTAGGQGGLEIYALAARHQITPGEDQLGTVYAVSAETGRTMWLHEQRAATMSVMATAGGLVFGGDVNGRFRALDQETGAVLWEINLGFARRRLPHHLRRRRPPVRRRQHRRRGWHKPADDARAAPQRGERAVRVRATGGWVGGPRDGRGGDGASGDRPACPEAPAPSEVQVDRGTPVEQHPRHRRGARLGNGDRPAAPPRTGSSYRQVYSTALSSEIRRINMRGSRSENGRKPNRS